VYAACGNRQTYTTMVTDAEKKPEFEATPQRPHEEQPPEEPSWGPSWGMMLVFIGLAMVIALAIAWAFIHPLLHRHF